mgnify:CR=1 FL=1
MLYVSTNAILVIYYYQVETMHYVVKIRTYVVKDFFYCVLAELKLMIY